MAISAPLIVHLVKTIGDIFRAAEVALLKVARDEIYRTLNDETHQVRLAAVKKTFQEVLWGAMANSEDLIRRAHEDAAEIGAEKAVEDLVAALGGTMDDYRDEGINRAAIRRLSVEVIGPARTAALSALRTVDDAYREVILSVTPGVVVGEANRRKAAQRALDKFADRGITGFTDKTGRRWELATYVEMSTRTQLARTMVDSHMDKLRSLGKNLVIVSDHARECHLCRPWEGKILAIDGTTGESRMEEYNSLEDRYDWVTVAGTVTEARLRGLMHPNCKHSMGLYIPGATPTPSTPTADPEGERAEALMRYYERQIRKWKKRKAVALGAADEKYASAYISHYQKQATALAKSSGAPVQRARQQIGRAR